MDEPDRDGPRFAGSSEMHARVNEHDWGATPIGAPGTWPHSLRSTVKTLLASRYPMVLTWGPHFTQFYNDGYASLIGSKHPGALGEDIRVTLAEGWDTLGPIIGRVMQTGVASWTPALPLLLERSGYREESYFSVSHAPTEDDEGRIVGMLAVCSEVTEQVLAERRTRLLRSLALEAGETQSVEQSCRDIVSAIREHPLDVPFLLLYLREGDGHTLALRGSVGVEAGTAGSPRVVDLASGDLASGAGAVWPLGRAMAGERVLVEDVERHLALRGGFFGDPVRSALVMPIPGERQAAPLGVLVAGLSPNRGLDEGYRAFYELLNGQVSIALRNARAYEDERRRAEMLAELDRAKTAFFSNVSHELRTPLTLVLGPVEEALATPARSLAGEDLATVHRNALRLLRLVNSLLDFSRIEAGRLQLSFEPTDLAAFTADLASSFRSLVERAGMRLVIDCPPLPEPIYVDRPQWEKIVLNLLSNAFKFTFEGEIAVSLAWHGDHVELSVRDTGTGIAADDIGQIFERFHRVNGARGRSYEGTGIGLALVQELVKLHGGLVRVTSTEDQGSTFVVSIPTGTSHLPAPWIAGHAPTPGVAHAAPYVLEAGQWLGARAKTDAEMGAKTDAEMGAKTDAEMGAAAQAGDAHAAQDARPGGPEAHARTAGNILLADDNADMREYLVRLLGTHYQVRAVGDGTAALQAALAQPPDLVLSDVMMPGLDGFALLRALRADARTAMIPVVLLSARAGEEAAVEGLETGADDYLIKPFSARELMARVGRALELARARRAAALASERERAQARLRVLAEATATLAESLEYEATLAHVAQLTVPILADWCFIDVIDARGRVRRVEVAHADRAHAEIAKRVQEFSSDLSGNPQHPGSVALREGMAVLREEMSEQHLRAMAHSEAHLQTMLDIAPVSLIAVPLVARGRLLGVLTLVTAQSGRRYGSDDLSIAQELAHRCALAIDNARLFQEAQEAIRVRDEFLSIASHELKTPLTPLQLQIHTLTHKVQEQADGEALRAWLVQRLGTLTRQGARLERLVDGLLDISRILGGRLELQLEPVELSEIVREVERQLAESGQLAAAGCELRTNVNGASVVGRWDRRRVEQVLSNLLQNALKYGAGKPITVTAHAAGAMAVLQVADQGIGIPPEDQERIFGRFERAVSERHYGGLGLGLFIARQMAEALGGTITVESEVGRGATFQVCLPLAGPSQREPGHRLGAWSGRQPPHHLLG